MAIPARSGMRELMARCQGHRAGLAEPGATEAFRRQADQIGNPELSALLAERPGSAS
jgi:hypothetical protein